MKSPRPKSVTILGWIFVAFGSMALLLGLFSRLTDGGQRPAEFQLQHPVQYALILVGAILVVVCGAAMLRGFNWARWVLVLYFAYNVIGDMASRPVRGLIRGLILGAVAYPLFRPDATAFFRGISSESTPAGPPPVPR